MSSPLLARVVDEAEARQLPALIHEWWDAHDVRRWLARALRIDLALLTERPELVVPCLHRRCAWLGGAAEAGFYAERSEVPRDAAALRELVGGWRPGRPWLRALRPPPIPLDGGVLEEYRTSLGGEVRISDDAEAIAVIGEDGAAAWDRLTGRRLEGARARLSAPAAPPQRWRMGRDTEWGRLVLERGDQRIELAYDDSVYEDRLSSVWPLTDELVMASGYHSHALVNVGTARFAWFSAGEIRDVQASPDGERLFRACRDVVEIAALATGETLAWWCAPDVHRLVLAPDGTVATQSPGVVRIWDPSLASRGRARPIAPHGWTPAQFSPDGARLVTGGLLCDGRTGAAIAVLDVDYPGGWLVGGPPVGCQRLTDAGMVEFTPHGLRLWAARDGSMVASHEGCRARIGDAVAFDPEGARCAIVPGARDDGPRSLFVYALRSGELVLERAGVRLGKREGVRPGQYGRAFALGFSPDGARLWWETPDGERWVLPLTAPDRARRLTSDEPTPCEPDPATIEVRDGLLAVGGAAIPCDDELAIASPDGRTFAYRTSHHALEDA